MYKKLSVALFCLVCMGLLNATGAIRYKALVFDNPGAKRLLKTEQDNYYYFRSLPEKTISLNTTGITSLELRSFAIERLRKPEIITIINKERKSYALELAAPSDSYQVYKPISITIPANTDKIEILCYSPSVYMRAFNILPPKPPKPVKLPNLVLKAHGGVINLQHNGSSAEYYSMMPSSPLKFTLNNSRNAVVYVRPRLLDRTLPQLGVYKNGELVQTIDFSLKRTTKYHVQGITSLGTGIKVELPANGGSSDYELRPLTDHLFIAKPVLIKNK